MNTNLSLPTNREVINAFKVLAADRTGKPSVQNQWSDRLILFYLKMFRSRVLYEKLSDPRQQLHRHNIQTIPCIEVSEIDQNECPCDAPSGCTFLKTVYAIPRPIGGKLLSVTTITGAVNYSFVRWDQFKHKLNSRFKFIKESGYYTLKNFGDATYLYVLQDTYKDFIAISGVFEDPQDVQNFPVCGLKHPINECNPLDSVFSIDRELLPIVLELTFNKLLQIRSTAQSDIINNDSDDTSIPVKNK